MPTPKKLPGNANVTDVVIELMRMGSNPLTHFMDVQVVREGAKITLPEGMSYQMAREWLEKEEEKEERVIAIHETIDAFPLDGAHALMVAMQKKFGWTSLEPTPGFFGDNPPAYLGVPISHNETIQVAWGNIAVPKIEGLISIAAHIHNGHVKCCVNGSIKLKHKNEIHDLINDVRQYVRHYSIYKGKAIRVDFPDVTAEQFNPAEHAPEFIDTTALQLEDLIFNPLTKNMIKNNLWTPIMFTKAVRNAGISLKRGILLEGPYGVGKTLTAMITAKICQEHGWTYIYINDVKRLPEAMRFGKMYSPSLIFTEDLDRADEEGDRDDTMNDILNVIDGVEYKNSEIMVVMSTNHVNDITKAMLRPGRLDAIISMTPPDAQTVPLVIKHYARELLDPMEDLTEVGKMLAGQIPASIREVVERSKLAAIYRSGGAAFSITAVDLQVAAESIMAHLNLLKEQPEDKRSKLERAASILVEGLRGERVI